MDSLDSGFLDSGSWIGSGNIVESKKKKKNERVTEEALASLIGGSVISVCVSLLVLLFIFVCVSLLVLLYKSPNAVCKLVCWMLKALDSVIGLFGGKSKKKLIFVRYAGANPIEKREVTEAEIPLILLNSKTLIKQLKEIKAEIPEILKVSKEITKESKITEFEIIDESMHPLTNIKNAFHVLTVFKTTSEIDEDYWWSLEKNREHIVLQQSRNKDDVKDKLYGKPRKQVKPKVENLDGKGTIKDLLEILLKHKVISESYNIFSSNCQSLVTLISKTITEEKYEYKGHRFIRCLDSMASFISTLIIKIEYKRKSLFLVLKYSLKRERNPKLKEFFESATQSSKRNRTCSNSATQAQSATQSSKSFESEWPPFNLIYLENTDLFDKVIKSGNYDINALHDGITPLHFALLLDKYEMVRHLLKLKPPNNADPTIRDSRNGRNALHMSASVKSHASSAMKGEIFDLLLAIFQDKIDDVDVDGRTALHLAASASNVIAFRKLLHAGANPNVPDNKGLTPLDLAKNTRIIYLIAQVQCRMRRHTLSRYCDWEGCGYSDYSVIRCEVFEKDAKFNSRNKVAAELLRNINYFLRVNNVNWVRCLIIGANHTRDEDNMVASQNTDLNFLDLILANVKVDINDGGKFGLTVLHLAMATSNVTAARFLLSKGANPNVAGKNGATPLHMAAYCADKTDVIDLILVNKQVDINGRDHNGQTALHYAARNNNVKTALYLLGNGADPAIRDNNGNTLFHLEAAFNKNSAILALLPTNENKTEIDEGNNAKDLDIIELPLIQKDVINVNSLVNSGAQQDIQSEQSEGISNPLKGVTPEKVGNPCDESKVKFPRKRRAALDGQEDSTQ